MKAIDIIANVEHSYDETRDVMHSGDLNRLEYLACYVFGFTTYDGDMDALFARKALEVCVAISTHETLAYQSANEEKYRWYLLMVNMPFFAALVRQLNRPGERGIRGRELNRTRALISLG